MLAIGAIFRDEYDYLLEWFAWHMIAGFKKFLIADNGSTDGSLALLEALSDIGLINLIYQPILQKQAQIVAYQRLAQLAVLENLESVLFIDADEFLVHESMTDGAEYQCLDALLKDSEVAMVGINWRTFGSSGHKTQTGEPVVVRFTDYCNIHEQSVNGYFKSISKIAFAGLISAHEGHFASRYRLVDSQGRDLVGFIRKVNGVPESVKYSGMLRAAIEGPLRVNHYVIKSQEEFDHKKMRRGDVMHGVSFQRNKSYFASHDFKDEKYVFPGFKIVRLKLEISFLEQLLQSSVFARKLKGSVDICNGGELNGWLVDSCGTSDGLQINIFVNDVWQGRVACGFYRPDLKEKNISTTGLSGFRYTHPKPLSPGDVVEVKVHANRYVFPARSRVVIE